MTCLVRQKWCLSSSLQIGFLTSSISLGLATVGGVNFVMRWDLGPLRVLASRFREFARFKVGPASTSQKRMIGESLGLGINEIQAVLCGNQTQNQLEIARQPIQHATLYKEG